MPCCYTSAAVRRPPPPTTRVTLIITALLLSLAGCSEPPQKEIDQAQSAVDLARTARADTYAAEEYAAASSGLQKARAAVVERDYRQALSYAIDARQRAQHAIRQAADGKARAQRATGDLVNEVVARTKQLQTALSTAEAARVPLKELRAPRAVVTETQKALQEARTEIGAENFDKAGEILSPVRKKLDIAIVDVRKIPQPSRTVKSKRR